MDPTVRNLEALILGTGEVSVSIGATSLADAQSKGYLDLGNVQVVGFKPTIDKVDHEGSYRGKKRIDKTLAIIGALEYSVKVDEIDREKLKLALGGVNTTNITQTTLSDQTGDTLAFGTTAAVIGNWYDILNAGVQVREITALKIRAAAVSCVADATANTITAAAHGLIAGETVVFAGTAVPTGLTANTAYYVVNPTTNDFQVASTAGGTAIDFTSAGTAVTFQRQLIENTDYITDTKIGRVRFLTAQAADRIPVVSANAIASGDAANLLGITPLDTLIKSGFARVAIFDEGHPNQLVYLHEGFSCQVYLDSASEFDGKKIPDITLKIRVTQTVGTIYSAE